MKSLILSLTIQILGFTSCQTANFNNFNKKKFTKLKPIEASYKDQADFSDGAPSTLIDQQIDLESNFKDDLDRVTDEDPKALAIKNAIEKGTPIVLEKDGIYYLVKEPFYDAITEKLDGKIEKLDSVYDSKNLEVTLWEELLINENESAEISISNVRWVEFKTGEPNEGRAKKTWKNEKIEKVKNKDLKEDPDHEVHSSQYKTKARKLFFQNLAIWYPLSAIFILLYLVALPFVIIGGLLVIYAFVTFARSAYNSRLYFDECKRAGIKPTKKAKRVRAWTWFILITMGIMLYCLPALIVLLIINGLVKKKAKKESVN